MQYEKSFEFTIDYQKLCVIIPAMNPIEFGPSPNNLVVNISESSDLERIGSHEVGAGDRFTVEAGESGEVKGIIDSGNVKFGHSEKGAWVGVEGNRFTVKRWDSPRGR